MPTWRDQGFEIEAEGWFGTYVPAGTPRAIIEKYSDIFTRAVRSEAGRSLLASFKVPPTGGPPDELDRVQRADAARWSAIIRAAGIKVEE